jgi:hypothetical protein
VCVALAAAWGPTTGEPSPKSKAYAAIGVASPSLDPDASAVTCRGALPETGVTISAAAGGESPAGVTCTAWVTVDEKPPVSVTVTVAVYVPATVNVCVALAAAWGPTEGEPSPKSKVYVAIGVESPSLDPDASAVTASGAAPDVGVTLKAAFGGASTG